jgi:WD40 repeat protein
MDINFSGDGKYLAIAADDSFIYSIQENKLFNLKINQTQIDGVDYINNNFVFISSKSNKLNFVSFNNQNNSWVNTHSQTLPIAKISNLSFSPDGKKIAVGLPIQENNRFAIKVYEIGNSRKLVEYKVESDFAKIKWFDGETLGAIFSNNKSENLQVWNLNKPGETKKENLGFIPYAGLMNLDDEKLLLITMLGNIFTVSFYDEKVEFIVKNSFWIVNDFDFQDFLFSAEGNSFQKCYITNDTPNTETLKVCPNYLLFDIADRSLNYSTIHKNKWEKPLNKSSKFDFSLSKKINELYYLKINDIQTEVSFNDNENFQNDYKRNFQINGTNNFSLVSNGLQLFLFDSKATKIWGRQLDDIATIYRITQNNRFAVVSFPNGIIKWYRIQDGEEVLSLLLTNDKKWVLWTPSGYYDASIGGEDLIGWHINNGNTIAPDFFPASKFRNRFYRPDVISKILLTTDETTALRLANEEAGRKEQETNITKQLPPVVEIISPQSDTEASNNQITIRYNVRSTEPVTNVKALIDGRPMERGVGVKLSNSSGITVTIPERDCEVSIIAENRFAPSVPATVRIKWKGKTPTITAESLKPKLYILAIGVSKYANAEFNLGLPSKDANDFVNVMLKQKGLLYRDIEVKLLTDTEATRDNIVDGLDWITKATTSRDVAMVFFAGHGINDNLNRYYFAPHNFDLERILRTGVTFSDIKNSVEAIAGKAVFFVDTCHSGNSIGTAKRRDGAVDINGMVNELSSAENGAVVFNASTGKQVSLEDPTWGNGAFTKALIEGLSGKATLPNGKITVKSLDLFISERVKQLTSGKQTPTLAIPNTVPDFPIAARQ